ncbi:MAG: M20/M25/M40 family metallo-hydrolase [Acidobacteriota bacterium]
MPLDPIRLCRDLIDLPSVTGDERAVSEFLETLLQGLGFATERQTVSTDRFNLFASAGGVPRVVFCTHTDTVPPFFRSSEDDEFVYGRGACDTKGIIAAMLATGESLRTSGLRDFGYLFVVGEETDSIGAREANRHFCDRNIELVVVGEPTQSRFVRASKGALTATVRFRGVAAHSAYPELGDSAVLKMVAAIVEISATGWGMDPILGEATANVGVIRGGEKPNIIPGQAELQMIFRTVGPPEIVSARLAEIVERHGGEIVASHGNPPTWMMVPPDTEAVVVAFNTDAPHLSALGKVMLFGPGSILDAHGAAERIAKSEIFAAIETYRSLATSWFSER